MIKESQGKIFQALFALGNPGFPTYLLEDNIPILFDAGITLMGPRYLSDLKKYLGEAERLGYLFLTHSHFDHCGAAPFLKKNIPGLKIGASRLAADIFKRPNAVNLIRSLNKELENKYKIQGDNSDFSFPGLEVEVLLEDGEEINCGGRYTIRVIATPGHTRDALSFYVPQLKALIAGEAVGVYDRHFTLHPEFLSSYHDYVSSLEKLSLLEIDILVLAHAYVLTAKDAQEFIPRSLEKTKKFKERIQENLKEFSGNQEEVVQRIFREDYQSAQAIEQDERSYLINLAAMVKAAASIQD